MTSKEVFVKIRELAKTHEYQSLYMNIKELHFQLFQNLRDFSSIQLRFLEFLNMYATICMDVYLKEVDEIVLENEIYEDAYMYYKQKENKKDSKEPEAFKPFKKDKAIEKVSQIKSTWQFRKRA